MIAIKTLRIHLARSLYEDNFNKGHETIINRKAYLFLVGMMLYYDNYLEINLLLFGSHFSFPLRGVISPQFT